jgi:hypothetical protein
MEMDSQPEFFKEFKAERESARERDAARKGGS